MIPNHTPPFRPREDHDGAVVTDGVSIQLRLIPANVATQRGGANERLDLFASPGKLVRHILNAGNLQLGTVRTFETLS